MSKRLISFSLTLLLFQALSNAQNVGIGIGTTTPLSPLDLGAVSGNRMIFWGEGNQTHYGIGSQNGNMQIYANLSADNIGFGLGSSNAFSQNLTMKGNGMVGIYNLNPEFRLDVNGRLKLSGIDSIITLDYDFNFLSISRLQLPSQLYFNNPANTAAVAKIGAMETFIPDVGYFGSGINATYFGILSENNQPRLGMVEGLDFNYNKTYSLSINGSIGKSGQILRSRGPNSGAYFTAPIQKELHNQLFNAYGGNFQLNNQLKMITFTKDLPFAQYNNDPYYNSYDLKTESKLLIKFRISARNTGNSCILCGPSIFDLVLTDNDNIVRTFRYSLPVNSLDTHVAGTAILNLPIGWHQIKMGGYMISGPNVDLGNLVGVPPNINITDGVKMIIEVIPSFK